MSETTKTFDEAMQDLGFEDKQEQRSFRISSRVGGVDLGVYEGSSEMEAYTSMLRDAGAAELDEIPEDIRVEEVEDSACPGCDHPDWSHLESSEGMCDDCREHWESL